MAQLSIIVTTYNVAPYLEECLDSLLAQTFTDTEILVVDDGSTDQSPEIIERYADNDGRIVPVLLETNSVGGVATAANAGLDRATSPWIGFADGDDYFEPTMFEKLHEAATSTDSDLAMCRYKLSDPDLVLTDPAEVGRWAQVDAGHHVLTAETRKRFLRFIAVPWRKLYRREMLETNSIRFPVGDYFYEDNPFHWFCVVSADSIALVPEVLCYHRIGRAGQTMATADERLFRIFAHHATIHAWLEDRGLLDAYAATLLAWAISQMEWIAPRTPPELRRQLFTILQGVYAGYTEEVVQQALVEGSKGKTARELSRTVTHGNFASFNRTLDAGPASSSLLTTAVYHLRYSGPRKSAAVAIRYARRLVLRMLTRARRVGDHKAVTNSDLMFASVHLDRRLARIEAELKELRGVVDEAEPGQT
jgi:glycosyltransferase involved in cell wall biosynthesis